MRTTCCPPARISPTRIGPRTRAINVSEVVSAMEAAPVGGQHHHSGCLPGEPLWPRPIPWLARVDTPPNSIVVYAADAGESAQDGLFTPILLKYITRPELSLSQVLRNTRRDVRVASDSKQLPGEYSMLETAVYLAGTGGGAAESGGPFHRFYTQKNLRAPLKKPHLVLDSIFSAATALSKCSRSPATLRFCRLVSTKNLFVNFLKLFFRGTLTEPWKFLPEAAADYIWTENPWEASPREPVRNWTTYPLEPTI